MPFTPEQDAFILMGHFCSETRNKDGSWSYFIQSYIETFTEAFPDMQINYEAFAQHKRIIIHCFEDKHCTCKSKSTGRPTIFTEKKVADLNNGMQLSLHKSISTLATQSSISVESCHKALRKNLHMYPHTLTVVQELFENDWEITNAILPVV